MKKRGVTLTETVVAMAIAVIVSLMAYTTCSFAISQNAKSKLKSFFINQTQNYVNCYYLGATEYDYAFEFLTGMSAEYGNDTTVYYDKDFNISSQAESKYHIDLHFANSNQNFSVKCYSDSSQSAIYEVEV